MSKNRSASIFAVWLCVASCGGAASQHQGSMSGSSSDCDAYLSCLQSLAKEAGQQSAYQQAAAIYGPGGQCHATAAALAACQQTCRTALQMLGSSCSATSSNDAGVTSLDGSATPHDLSSSPDIAESKPGVCTIDAQCGGLSPYCDASSGACVACYENSQCPSGEVCSLLPLLGIASCCPPATVCKAGQCGAAPDGCGGTIQCGSCATAGDSCIANMCRQSCDLTSNAPCGTTSQECVNLGDGAACVSTLGYSCDDVTPCAAPTFCQNLSDTTPDYRCTLLCSQPTDCGPSFYCGLIDESTTLLYCRHK